MFECDAEVSEISAIPRKNPFYLATENDNRNRMTNLYSLLSSCDKKSATLAYILRMSPEEMQMSDVRGLMPDSDTKFDQLEVEIAY